MKKLREESNLRKTDTIDAMVLARISKDHFKQLMIEELERRIELDSLISRYKLYTRRIKTLKQWIKRDGWDYGLRDAVKLMERSKKDVAKRIIKAISSDAVYREACKMLGIKGDSIGLAILTAKLPLYLPLKRLKGILGLIPNRNRGRYDHELRRCIADFAIALYINANKC